MPHPDYAHQACVLFACSGEGASTLGGQGPQGKFISKARTRLSYAVADVRAWQGHFARASVPAGFTEVVNHHLLVEEASAADVEAAIEEAVARLDFHHETSSGGSLNLVFSGHGFEDGDLCLSDGALSIDQLMEWCAAGRAGQAGKTRHLRVAIDACYSGLALARMLLHPTHWGKVVLRDAFASSLPSEESYELDRLGHSAFTHSMVGPYANVLPPPPGQGDWSERDYREWSRAQRETTQYLTNGQQHSLDVMNGHHVTLRGASGRSMGVEVDPEAGMQLDELRDALDNLSARRRRP